MSEAAKLALANTAGSIAVLATLFILYACVGSVEYAALGGCTTDTDCERLEAYVQAHRGLEAP